MNGKENQKINKEEEDEQRRKEHKRRGTHHERCKKNMEQSATKNNRGPNHLFGKFVDKKILQGPSNLISEEVNRRNKLVEER